MKMRKKSDLPSKTCACCGLPLIWRRNGSDWGAGQSTAPSAAAAALQGAGGRQMSAGVLYWLLGPAPARTILDAAAGGATRREQGGWLLPVYLHDPAQLLDTRRGFVRAWGGTAGLPGAGLQDLEQQAPRWAAACCSCRAVRRKCCPRWRGGSAPVAWSASRSPRRKKKPGPGAARRRSQDRDRLAVHPDRSGLTCPSGPRRPARYLHHLRQKRARRRVGGLPRPRPTGCLPAA